MLVEKLSRCVQILLVAAIVVAVPVAKASIAYSFYESADGSGAAAAVITAPSGLVQNTSDWGFSYIAPIAGNPISNFDLGQPMLFPPSYTPADCFSWGCTGGRIWISQVLADAGNRFSFYMGYDSVPQPEFPLFDGVYSGFGYHDAGRPVGGGFLSSVCSLGECAETNFLSMRIEGAGSPLPEPGTLLLLGVGLAGCFWQRRNRDFNQLWALH